MWVFASFCSYAFLFYFVLSATVCLDFPVRLCCFVNLRKSPKRPRRPPWSFSRLLVDLFVVPDRFQAHTYEIGIAITRSGNFGAFLSAPGVFFSSRALSGGSYLLLSSSSFSSLICPGNKNLSDLHLAHGCLLTCAV